MIKNIEKKLKGNWSCRWKEITGEITADGRIFGKNKQSKIEKKLGKLKMERPK